MNLIRISNLLFLVFFISSCGGGGSSSSSVNSITTNNITIDFQPSLSDAPVGSEITLTWSSDNTTGCQASNGWSGLKSTSGSEIMQVSNKSGANTYTLTCFNGTHSTISTSTVNSRNVNQTEAFHFLNQATFGATESEANSLSSIDLEAWIEDQFLKPASLYDQILLDRESSIDSSLSNFQHQRRLLELFKGLWIKNAVLAEDQLRQRVAFALSEIFVISMLDPDLSSRAHLISDYYDLLVSSAFGNYRDLMEDVTLHPAMGLYLDHLSNEKPDTSKNIRPDENYARELLQLFTIGLVDLNIDGTVQRDSEGVPLQSVDQSIIEGFAHVFTGWHFDKSSWSSANNDLAAGAQKNSYRNIKPMKSFNNYHDKGEKKLLNGTVLAADSNASQDLKDALDNIYAHPNLAPFVSYRLIQRLVKSNPSKEYVGRVANIFNNNGSGVKGDLKSVIKAILLDQEARTINESDLTAGKLKEPILRATQLWRAYGLKDIEYDNTGKGGYIFRGFYGNKDILDVFGQGPLQSPSVFNFFSPFYSPPGEISNQSLVAPELEIATEYQNTNILNFFWRQTFNYNSQKTISDIEVNYGGDKIISSLADFAIDIDEEAALASDTTSLIDRVATKLLGGNISDDLKSSIKDVIDLYTDEPDRQASIAIYLIVTSPEFTVQG
ncbi:MAG: hypothetical protein CMQ51_02610 [Gammaproteobacteria bacterium]|nr:hypothetical protein [Gammaproteobacteria bacterium]